MKRRHGLVAVALGGIFLLAGSSCDEKGLGDAPVGDQFEVPVDVVLMPDEFPNVAVACHPDGFRLFVTTSREVRVIEDESCLR